MTSVMPTEDYDLIHLREAEHRHRNALQILATLIRRRRIETPHDEARAALTYVGELVEVLGGIEAELDLCGVADLARQLEVLADRMQKVCDGYVRIRITAETMFLPPQQATTSSLIALELIFNAIKHAFPDGRGGAIDVELRQAGPSHARLSVADDGVGVVASSRKGMAGSESRHTGNGLVEALAHSLGATIERGQRDGTGHSVTVQWPR